MIRDERRATWRPRSEPNSLPDARPDLRPDSRGFTLTELAIVMSLASVIAGATGLFYLEVRTAGIIVESQVALERRAALVFERLARDLRAGDLDPAPPTVTITRPDGLVTYELTDGRIVRVEGLARRTLTRYAKEFSVTASPGGYRAQLQLVRPLLRGRRLTVSRAVFVGTRR